MEIIGEDVEQEQRMAGGGNDEQEQEQGEERPRRIDLAQRLSQEGVSATRQWLFCSTVLSGLQGGSRTQQFPFS